jgi:hypothetical protein
MLRDGKFIKEDPPRIGKFYIPKFKEDTPTPEERLAQSILLNHQETKYSFLSKVLSIVLRV